ncbi:MAG: Bax inhibitor-1/YccA family protein [Planctomycetota bacterium]
MAMFGGGNPALKDDTFQMPYDRAEAITATPTRSDVMTMGGTIWKTFLLLAACVAAATFTWNMTTGGTGNPGAWAIGGVLSGFVLYFIIAFKPTLAPFLAPVYAVGQGLALGAISAIFEAQFGSGTAGGMPLNGLVAQAIGLTFGTTAAMLILYATRIITVGEKFRAVMSIAIGGAFLFYISSFVLGLFFGIDLDPIANASPLSIGISVVLLIVAALTLLLDFDLIERGAASGAPKYMEWYGAFALLVTLVWLYIEFLRLLAKLQNRN